MINKELVYNLHLQGKTDKEIMDIVGCKKSSIGRIINIMGGRKWRAGSSNRQSELKDSILKLYQKGLSNSDIAKELNMDTKKVIYHLYTMNINNKSHQSVADIDDYENKILKLYHLGYNSKDIAKELGLKPSNYRMINKILKQHDLKPRGRTLRIPTNIEKEMCDMYNNGYTQFEIFEEYKEHIKSESNVHNLLLRNNINLRRVGTRSSVENHNYFDDIDTEKKAYFLGLIISDGCVMDNNTINLGLSIEDSYLIEEFGKEIGFTGKYYIRERKKPKKDGTLGRMFVIRFISKQMAESLSKYGVIPRKTGYEYLPDNIDERFMPALIRGIFDGDGTVYMSKYLRFGFYGSHRLCEQILEYFNFEGISVFDKKSVSTFITQRVIYVQRFYNIIYNNATIYMTRKKIKFDNHMRLIPC